MAQIRIKGINKFIDVSEETARQIALSKKTFKETGKDTNIDLKEVNTSASEVLFIHFGKSEEDEMAEKMKNNDEYINQLDREYRSDWKFNVKKTPEQKANSITLFRMLYETVNKKQVTEDIVREVIEIQTKFFNENKNRTICNPVLFRKFFGGDRETLDSFQSGAFKIYERIFAQDMIMSERL